MSIEIGAAAPGFTLTDTHGEQWGPVGGAATVIVFTCNHCPYALAWHDRLLAVAADYAGRGVRMLLVCSNDPERQPRDSAEAMAARVEAEGPWPAPYLHDATQEVARIFGATVTPEVFLLDEAGRLRYRGAPDADHSDPALAAAWLREALELVLAGDPPVEATTQPVGCSIKWREEPRLGAVGRVVLGGGELALEDLAGRVARQLVHEHDLARDLVAGEVLLDVRLELVLGGRARRCR